MPVVASAGDSTDTARGVPRTARPRDQLPLPQAAVPTPRAPERFEVPELTARLVQSARKSGHRVVAVGTTVVRALETAARPDGGIRLAARIVTGLVTGLHVPEASHLLLLEAVAGAELVGAACAAAVERRYLWHEVGDSTLFLPDLA